VCPRIVLEFEYRDIAVGGSAGEEAADLMGRPGDDVDGSGMQGDFVDLLPGRRLFAPDDDLAVVRGGCEDVAVLGVRPCDTPYRALVSIVLSVPGTCSAWR
jgi:hypothetical protein